MPKTNKVPSHTRGKGFSPLTEHKFKHMKSLQKAVTDYAESLNNVYTQCIQHAVIYALATQLAEFKEGSIDELVSSASAEIPLDTIVNQMVENSGYPKEECMAYILYRADMRSQMEQQLQGTDNAGQDQAVNQAAN